MTSESRPFKRARPVQSCVNCRLKKLKCNRGHPCSACVIHGISGECTFDPTIGSMSARNTVSTSESNATDISPLQGTVTLQDFLDLKARVELLELGFSKPHPQKKGPIAADDISGPVPHKLLEEFSGARDLLKMLFNDPELDANVFQALRAKFPKLGLEQGRLVEPPSDEASLLQLALRMDLEQFKTFDEQMPSHNYIMMYSDIEQSVKDISLRQQPRISLQSLYWMYQLVTCYNETDLAGTHVQRATDLCSSVDFWLSFVAEEDAFRLHTIQIQALQLLLRMRTLAFCGPKYLWSHAGNLTRKAIAANLHEGGHRRKGAFVDLPSDARRLWATIVELDLQTSIAAKQTLNIPSKYLRFPETGSDVHNRTDLSSTLNSRLSFLSSLTQDDRSLSLLDDHRLQNQNFICTGDLDRRLGNNLVGRMFFARCSLSAVSLRINMYPPLFTSTLNQAIVVISLLDGSQGDITPSVALAYPVFFYCFMFILQYFQNQSASAFVGTRWDGLSPNELLNKIDSYYAGLVQHMDSGLVGRHLKDIITIGMIIGSSTLFKDVSGAYQPSALKPLIHVANILLSRGGERVNLEALFDQRLGVMNSTPVSLVSESETDQDSWLQGLADLDNWDFEDFLPNDNMSFL